MSTTSDKKDMKTTKEYIPIQPADKIGTKEAIDQKRTCTDSERTNAKEYQEKLKNLYLNESIIKK